MLTCVLSRGSCPQTSGGRAEQSRLWSAAPAWGEAPLGAPAPVGTMSNSARGADHGFTALRKLGREGGEQHREDGGRARLGSGSLHEHNGGEKLREGRLPPSCAGLASFPPNLGVGRDQEQRHRRLMSTYYGPGTMQRAPRPTWSSANRGRSESLCHLPKSSASRWTQILNQVCRTQREDREQSQGSPALARASGSPFRT